jgi:maltose alpha-D-glucosyltransferase / alpha-amylase
VPNQGDGWSYTLAYLQRTLENPRGLPEGVAQKDVHGAYLALVQTLGTRTAQLHRALALKSGDAAFEPEPMTGPDVVEWKKRVREEAGITLARLDPRPDVDRILQLIDACEAPREPAYKIRHHGDYHLGQVLLANNDFLIIDFEGEPARPLAESRRKRSPLRDVAGMLRSFSYAAASSLARAPAEPPGERERLAAALGAWEADARRAFLAAYAEAMEGSGVFASLDDVRGLLRLAEIEKLLYELRYELDNRPAWVSIPLGGLAALTETSKGG